MADGGEEKIVYKLDLDAEAFMKTLGQVNERLGSIEKSAKTTEIASAFVIAEGAAKAFHVALNIAEKAMEAVFEGEKIQRVEKQFAILTKSLGIASNEFKEQIERATGGLITETDALMGANRAMLTMGESAERFSEIITIARKATAVFGGEFKDNLEDLTRTISIGNVRALKNQFGVIVDADKALKKYAASLGVATSELTEQGKKHAIANAAIDTATTKFKDITVSTNTAKASFSALKVSIEEIKEVVEVVIAKTVGPIFISVFKAITAELKTVKEHLQSTFSTDVDTRAKAVSGLMDGISERMEKMKNGPKEMFSQADYDALNKKLSDYREQLGLIQEEQRKLESLKPKTPEEKAAAGSGDVDKDKQLLNQNKFEQDLLSLKKARVTEELAVESDLQNNLDLIDEQHYILAEENRLQLAQLDIEYKGREVSEHQRIADLKNEIDASYVAKVEALTRQEADTKMKAYESGLKAAKTSASGTAAAFKLEGAKVKKELNDVGVQGTRHFNMLNKASATAFHEIGKGAKDASEIAKGFVLGMIADEAQYKGEMYLAEGLAEMNPGKIAGGGTLIALSEVVRSAGGSGAANSGSASSGGGGGSPNAAEALNGPSAAQVAAPKKQVTIQVQGSYFETEQTKQRLMEMIRDQTDATDFAYKQIGSK